MARSIASYHASSSRSAKHSRAVGRSKLDPVQLRRILIADIAHWLASNYL
jgi:hypothetical protein